MLIGIILVVTSCLGGLRGLGIIVWIGLFVLVQAASVDAKLAIVLFGVIIVVTSSAGGGGGR